MMCVGSTNTRKTQLSNRRHARVACMDGSGRDGDVDASVEDFADCRNVE